MRKRVIEKGEKYGRLTIIKEVESLETKCGKKRKFLCECNCGKKTDVSMSHLATGHTKSCGCYNSESRLTSKKTHGMRYDRIYKIWAGIKTRCLNEKTPKFKYWGGRGIRVCDRWKNSFELFYEDMKEGYSDNLSIDRIDNDGNYEKDNCKWSTAKEQANNRRGNNR